ncbi:unnamed protein product [Polarella glacialis]|uniref:Gluconokinase n=1 Tax=Polarella glacialis TaxID=89957 RepID=A0A813FGT2_POLGL|nr:unnamed protein product [Polarella glacialis]CAE8723369.1 unnamed protein product [Polarella glacialis]
MEKRKAQPGSDELLRFLAPVYFFGLPGAGKSHCGRLAEQELGYHFHDGDAWLPEDLKASLARGEGFTPEQRDRYAEAIVEQIAEAKAVEAAARCEAARPIAIAQATFKRRHRNMIRAVHPDLVFVWVQSGEQARLTRLRERNHLVDEELGVRMARDFEPPQDGEECLVLQNGVGEDPESEADLVQRLRGLLQYRHPPSEALPEMEQPLQCLN